ncbi:MAG: hypothetical protein WC547_11425, partial [Candidatus Omnitrophota bacterium]
KDGKTSVSNALIDNVDLYLTPPGGESYWGDLPTGVSIESPSEKMVVENPQAGEWTVTVYFYHYPVSASVSQETYAVIADVIYKTPALEVVLYDTAYYTKKSSALPVNAYVKNSGGHVIAGANLKVANASFTGDVNLVNYAGNLNYQNDVKGCSFNLTTPSSEGTYTLTFTAGCINLGVSSVTGSASVIVDETNPTGSAKINSDTLYASSTAVVLNLSASDARSGLGGMRFSNNGSTWSSWETYAASKAWTLAAGDGVKTVYSEFRDRALNTLQCSDTIILDTQNPTGSILINGDTVYTSSAVVTLTLSAADGGSGMGDMRFSNDGSTWSAWEPYATSKSWTVSSGDGAKTVYAQFRDRAGASAQFNDGILLDSQGPSGTVIINSGALYTVTSAVTLTLNASDQGNSVALMRFVNDGGAWSSWEPYASVKSWSLDDSEGTRSVYAEFKDGLGNTVQASAVIQLDSIFPAGTVSIAGGGEYTNSKQTVISLAVADTGSGLTEMRFSSNGILWSAWESYNLLKNYTLSAGDGVKTAYAQVKDLAGNISQLSDTVVLDTVQPEAAVLINGDTQYALSQSVILSLASSDAGSGLSEMRFSNDGSVWGSRETYGTTKSWVLSPGDGVKTVYGQISDMAGNEFTCSDTVLMDLNPPDALLLINSGDAYAPVSGAALTISATDSGSGLFMMQFSSDGASWGQLENYSSSKTMELGPGDGVKSVYAKISDRCGHTTLVSDSIILDTRAPSGYLAINDDTPWLLSPAVTLKVTVADTVSGCGSMCFSEDGVSWSAWENYSETKAWTFGAGEGLKTLYCRVRDNAGNILAIADTAILDSQPPSGMISIEDDASYTVSSQ